jgi:hypothetical protein
MQIQKGRYYRNHWLQHVGNIIGERVYVADFAGISIVSRDHFMRWAKVEYTEEEVRTKFPKEYAEIEESKARFYRALSFRGVSTSPLVLNITARSGQPA